MAKKTKILEPLPILGEDTSKPGEYLTARATTYARNIRIKRGLIQKRPGTEVLGDSLGERVQRLIELDTGESKHFYRIGPTKFEEMNKTTLVWTSRANAPLTAADTDMVSVALPVLAGVRILIYTNNVDAIRKCTGSGNDADLGGSPPLAKFMLYFGAYVILAFITDGGNVFPWRVQWCDTNDPEEWSDGNADSQELLEDSSDITGLGYFGQYFTVHKENAIYLGSLTQASSVFRFERRATGAGTIAANSIQVLPTGEQIFLARDGIRIFNGISASLVDSPINDDIRDYMNPEHAYKAWSKVVKEQDEYWVGIPIGGDEEPSTVYKFNYVTRQIHIDSRPDVTACGDYINTTGQIAWDDLTWTWNGWVGPWNDIRLASLNPVLCFGDVDGECSRQNSGSSDIEEAIDTTWDSKDFGSSDFGLDANKVIEWQGLYIWARGSGDLEIFYSIDSGNTWITAGTVEVDSDYPSDLDPTIAYFHVVSAKLRIRIHNLSDGDTYEIKQFGIMAVPMDEENN